MIDVSSRGPFLVLSGDSGPVASQLLRRFGEELHQDVPLGFAEAAVITPDEKMESRAADAERPGDCPAVRPMFLEVSGHWPCLKLQMCSSPTLFASTLTDCAPPCRFIVFAPTHSGGASKSVCAHEIARRRPRRSRRCRQIVGDGPRPAPLAGASLRAQHPLRSEKSFA